MTSTLVPVRARPSRRSEAAGDAPAGPEGELASTRRRRHWRLALATVVALAVAVFVVSRRSDLVATTDVLRQLQTVPLLIALALSVAAVVCRGALSRAAYRAVGLESDLGSMVWVSAAAYGLNKVLKTGGLGGMTLFVRHGTARRRPAGQVTAAYVLASLAAQFALVAAVLVAIGSMAASGALSGPLLVVAGAVTALIVIGLAGFVAATGRRSLVRSMYAAPHATLSRLATLFGRPGRPAPDTEHADRFYEAARLARHPANALPLLGYALAAKLLGAAVLTASLAATGTGVGFGQALAVYVISLVAAVVGILPGGLGAVEASMGALLTGFGVAAPVAIGAVLTFRLFDLWLPALLGLVAARILRSRIPNVRAP